MRDNFDTKTTETVAKRASFICSNPDCRCLTLAASELDKQKFIYNGIAAHITAASEGGPRFDKNRTPEERKSISNAIFLCANCATTIDKNNGVDFPEKLLLSWRDQHEKWIRENLNKDITNTIVEIDGQHHAKGIGNVIGLEIKRPAVIKPGTVVTAEGIGNVTGTKIG